MSSTFIIKIEHKNSPDQTETVPVVPTTDLAQSTNQTTTNKDIGQCVCTWLIHALHAYAHSQSPETQQILKEKLTEIS